MAILAMDQFGRIYETSADRSDGKGFERHASRSGRRDLTLGNEYMKAECAQRDFVQAEKFSRDEQDRITLMEQKKRQLMVAEKRRLEMAEEELMQNENYYRNRVSQAIQMGCACDPHKSTDLSGYGLTANGLHGFAGMNPMEQKLKAAMTGKGMGVIPAVDATEMYQHQMKQKADMLIANQARKEAAKQKAEYAQDKLDQARRKMTAKPAYFTSPILSLMRYR